MAKDYPVTKRQASLSLKLAILGAITGAGALIWQIMTTIIEASK